VAKPSKAQQNVELRDNRMTFFAVLLLSLLFGAWAQAEYTYYIHLSNRSQLSQEVHQKTLADRQKGLSLKQGYFDDASWYCPNTHKKVQAIFDRLVTSSKLQEWAQGPLGFYAVPYCRKYGVFDTHTGSNGIILISYATTSLAKTEDQLAYIMAHEIGHLIKAHDEIYHSNGLAGGNLAETLKPLCF
jgi:Zn-dependent protease with chaperone function